ncbi:MAG TPA: hypothetical protein VHD36_24520 [Pirellulales bacterium]|nr:hypothetical protein [Pirellulales bacterium]
MHVAVTIDRRLSVEEVWPMRVQCTLIDAAGKEWIFEDKHVIFTTADINTKSDFPQTGSIRCRIVETRVQQDGRTTVVVDTELPDHVESTTGETRFDVFAEQLEGPLVQEANE